MTIDLDNKQMVVKICDQEVVFYLFDQGEWDYMGVPPIFHKNKSPG